MIFFNKPNKISSARSRALELANANRRLAFVKKQQLQLTSLNDIKNRNVSKTMTKAPGAALFDKRLMNKMTNDVSVFHKKLESKKDQLAKIEEAWKRQMSSIIQQVINNINGNPILEPFSPKQQTINKQNLIIPPYKGKSNIDEPQENQQQEKEYSKEELQNLINIANNGSGKAKEEAIKAIKAIIQKNNEQNHGEYSPKLIDPRSKKVTTEVKESVQNDKEFSSEIHPIHVETNDKILRRLITEVYDEKHFEYQKFIDCIYNISSTHKTNPVLIPILNKALGRINRMSIVKLPEELMNKFIHVVLEELWPDTFNFR